MVNFNHNPFNNHRKLHKIKMVTIPKLSECSSHFRRSILERHSTADNLNYIQNIVLQIKTQGVKKDAYLDT